MPTNTFGQLVQVNLRSGWSNESSDFTPWLAAEENIRLLGKAIDMELQVEAQEKQVGPFRADILCKNQDDHWVLIENQLERTDHTHLGQLLTYAAGLQAVTIVWIAQRFTEEHRAALDWLNEITDERFNFFGLEIELWRIGDSPIAPKFNVVCKPNDWSKKVTAGATRVVNESLTEKTRLQLEFWTEFATYVQAHAVRIKPSKPAPSSWMNFALGRSGFQLTGIAAFFDSAAGTHKGHEIRAEVYIKHLESETFFNALAAQKVKIEAEFGEPLTWFNPPDTRARRIYVRKPVSLFDRERWPEYFAWLLEKLERLHQVFSPLVTQLDLDEYAEVEELPVDINQPGDES